MCLSQSKFKVLLNRSYFASVLFKDIVPISEVKGKLIGINTVVYLIDWTFKDPVIPILFHNSAV